MIPVKLKDKDVKVLDFIKAYVEENHVSPTIRDIQLAVDIKSTQTVYAILARLEVTGNIRRNSNSPRSIQVLNDFSDYLPPLQSKEVLIEEYGLTERQYEIYMLIRDYVETYHIAPTMQELCYLSKMRSKSSIYNILVGLERRGVIERRVNSERNMKILV